MGIGTVLPKIASNASCFSRSSSASLQVVTTGITTPHSQLRQLILGLPVLVSFTKRPLDVFLVRSTVFSHQFVLTAYQALSDRLALPTYAQHGVVWLCGEELAPAPGSLDCNTLRTKISFECIRSPSRVLAQSRISSLGNVGACHHLGCTHIVPAAYNTPNTCQYALCVLEVWFQYDGKTRSTTHSDTSTAFHDSLVCWKVYPNVIP
jgi:hypothetical protein